MDNSLDYKLIPLADVAKLINEKSFFDDVIVFESNSILGREPNSETPIRIDALVIVHCLQGESKVMIDLKEYTIKENTLMILHPRNYLLKSTPSPDFKASLIMCSKNIVEEVMPRLTDIAPLLVQQRSNPYIELTKEEGETLNKSYQFLKQKLNDPHTPFFRNKIINIMQSMFYELMDLAYTRNSIDLRMKSRKHEILAKFILAVSEHFKDERQVSYYAEKICVSPKHLSAVVKDLTGKTAGDWIEIYVTMEAKMLLRSSDLTIQEISNRLNFTNQSFFGKYFKHQTGYSPSEYRNKKK